MRCFQCNSVMYCVSESKYKDRTERNYRCMKCGNTGNETIHQSYIHERVHRARKQKYSEGRDKGRIDKILSHVRDIWKKYPELRLGQLIGNCFTDIEKIYYIEDDKIDSLLKDTYYI